MYYLFLVIVVFTLWTRQPSPAQTLSSRTEKIDSVLSHSEALGISIAVVDKGQVIFNKGYGMANLEEKNSVDTSTVFNIASLTKHFTAFSILLLEQQRLLSLQDEVQKYLPDFPFKSKRITIEHLLHHTSGIRDYMHLQIAAGIPVTGDYTNHYLLEEFKKQETLNFEPGTSVMYSNTNYLLLAEIVQKVSGMSLDKFCSRFIFEPLQMNHSFFPVSTPVKNMANSYDRSPQGTWSIVPGSTGHVIGPVGVYATSGDIAKWLNNLSTCQVGGKEVVKKFLSSTQLQNGTKIHSNSCVLSKKNYQGHRLYFSNGTMGGYRSQLFYFPDLKKGIVLLSNSGNSFNVYEATQRIAKIVVEGVPPVPKIKTYKDKQFTVKNLTRFQGQYDLGSGFKVSVKLNENKLQIKSVWDTDYLEMIPVDSNAFLVDQEDYRDKEIRFIYEEEKKQYVLVYNHVSKGYQYQYQPLLKNALLEYEGGYYSKELETLYTIQLKDSALYIVHRNHSETKLLPMSHDVFEAGKWWLDKIEFIRNEKDLITGFNMTLDRIQQLPFSKVSPVK